ncbi:ABC transporter ATP-binding protein [Candidatus Bipolaricaulota bacterium]|nr:ABC transporter ATP-binding protein [Candidatus Bipolaricaulota bacterium]
MDEKLLSVKDLIIEYQARGGTARAIDNVSLNIREGKVLGLVGESGCGKSTLGLSVMKLLPRTGKVVQGEILFKGRNLLDLPERIMNKEIRGREIAMIIQDPLHALNPVFKIGTQIMDVLRFHKDRRLSPHGKGVQLRNGAAKMLEEVGIADPAERLTDYPFQFSGGMNQRVMIAMAFICNPSLLIADEPTTALDVTIEAQILELLKGLVKRYKASVLYITHDLGVISEISDRVAVMYAGNIVEYADTTPLFEDPKHPYTEALLRCLPGVETQGKRLSTIPGRVPELTKLPKGCKFHPRCPYVKEACKKQTPRLLEISSGHSIACLRYER